LDFETLQVYGPESSGKTTLALHAIAEIQVCDIIVMTSFCDLALNNYGIKTYKSSNIHMQKLGGNAMLVDAEHAFDPAYSKALGVDIENLIVCQPDNGEMALESNPFRTYRVQYFFT
jgi:recombination protein RecA